MGIPRPIYLMSINLLAYLHLWLAGTIPREMGNLQNLQLLDLEWNQITGSIPREIGNLTMLTELYFANNSLIGKYVFKVPFFGEVNRNRLTKHLHPFNFSFLIYNWFLQRILQPNDWYASFENESGTQVQYHERWVTFTNSIILS